MSPEVALLDELWDIVKVHVPKKDRVEFAETILRTFEDHLSLDDARMFLPRWSRKFPPRVLLSKVN